MADIVLSEFVEPELAAIWDYIAYDNADAADRFLTAVQSTLEELARMPGIGRAREFVNSRLKHLRSFRVTGFENHLIFYAPIPSGIEVFHVLHGARDLEQFFSSSAK